MMLLPRRWREQPSGSVEIDWSHPLARGLIFLWPGAPGDYRDLVKGRIGTPTGDITHLATKDGRYQLFNQSTASYVDFPVFGQNELTSTQPTTIGWRQARLNHGSYGSVIQMSAYPPGSSGFIVIEHSADASYIFTAGALAGLVAANFSSVVDKTDGKGLRYVLTCAAGIADASGTASNYTLFENTSKFVGAALSTFISDSNAAFRIGADHFSEYFKGQVGMVAVWNRALTDAEAFAYNENPFQILKPLRRYFALPTATGGGATFSFRSLQNRQPTQPTGVDWSNPFARGLLRLYDFGQAKNNIDVIYGTAPKTLSGSTNGEQIGFGKQGLIGRRIADTGKAGRWDGSFRSQIKDKITWFCLVEVTSTVSGFLLGDVEESGAGYNSGLYISAGDAPTFFVKTGGTGTAAVGFSAMTNRGLSLMVGTYDGSSVNIYLDGALELGGVSGSSGNIDASSFDVMLDKWNGSSAQTGIIFFGGVANRCWTPTEVKAFAKNPWQLFAGQAKIAGAVTAAAGVAAVGSLGEFDAQLRVAAWF